MADMMHLLVIYPAVRQPVGTSIHQVGAKTGRKVVEKVV